MSYPVFMVPSGDVLPVLFHTYDGGTGASITLTGLAVTDIEIYKDGSVTQRASDAGYTLLDTDGIDFDGVTGIHGFSIDTGDNTDAGFYTVGAWFTVVISAVTIDAQTVNFIACQFRLMAAESIAAKPKVDVDGWLGTACATPTTNGVPEVDLTHIAGSAVSTTTAQLGVNVVQVSGDSTAADNLELFMDGTGYAGGTTKLDVNVAQISTDATAADNAEAFFDGTGYAGTGNVIPTVTTLTNKSGFTLDSAEHTNVADALLKRDLSVVTGEAARSPLNALRFLRNKWSISGTTLTVTKEDDATSAWTSTITATPGADPITANDPA